MRLTVHDIVLPYPSKQAQQQLAPQYQLLEALDTQAIMESVKILRLQLQWEY